MLSAWSGFANCDSRALVLVMVGQAARDFFWFSRFCSKELAAILTAPRAAASYVNYVCRCCCCAKWSHVLQNVCSVGVVQLPLLRTSSPQLLKAFGMSLVSGSPQELTQPNWVCFQRAWKLKLLTRWNNIFADAHDVESLALELNETSMLTVKQNTQCYLFLCVNHSQQTSNKHPLLANYMFEMVY